MKRLLEITKKVLQLREMIRRVIQKSQIELDRKFEEMKIQVFQKRDLVQYFNKPVTIQHNTKFQPK